MAKPNGKKNLLPNFRVNQEIKVYGNVRIVGEGIESKVVNINEARKLAESMELDLVELQGRQEIPVLKICNYEKMLYEMKKAAKKNKQAVKQMKDIQLRPNIAKHDLETKANNARKFIEDGCRVRVILMMKGRELLRREENKKAILEFIVMLDDVAVPEAQLKDEGSKTTVILKKRK